jgi:hypothetical protein
MRCAYLRANASGRIRPRSGPSAGARVLPYMRHGRTFSLRRRRDLRERPHAGYGSNPRFRHRSCTHRRISVGRLSSSLYAHDAVAGPCRSVELSHLRRQGAAGHLGLLFSRHEQSLLTARATSFHHLQAQQLTPASFAWLQTSPAMVSCCPMCDSLVARSL